jgi:hypothetical protein
VTHRFSRATRLTVVARDDRMRALWLHECGAVVRNAGSPEGIHCPACDPGCERTPGTYQLPYREVQELTVVDDPPIFIHAWSGYERPKAGAVPGVRGLDYCTGRLYQHTCGHVEDWPTTTALDGEGCDACESAPVPAGWQPLYRRGDSFQDGTQ